MSKAFTRESDDAPERPVTRQSSALPPGAKNYLTPDGAQRMRAELESLERERLGLTAPSSSDHAKTRLQELERRVLHIKQILESAVVVPPPATEEDRVRFGATVTVRETNGEETQYRIVGVDETDFDRGWVSWLSPIARALVNAQVGRRVKFKSPAGDTELEIVRVAYK